MDLKKKKLLILGGFAQVCDIVEDAKRKGIHVIVTDYLENSPAKKIADESYMLSITDVDGIVRLCNEKGIDGVMNYCIDPGQKPYQQICEKLNLPSYGTKEQFDIMTNKDRFKEECIKYGLDVIQSYKIDETLNKQDVEKIEYPVIIKPADGRASKGTSICYNESELPIAIKTALLFSDRGKIIAEKYLQHKQEVVIKYFICNGEIFFTSMSDLYTCYNEDGERAYIGSQIFPSKFYELYKKTADQKVRDMINGLGIKNGAMSFDGFVDGDKFRFFDPSFRMGGAQDWRIVASISGVNISELLTNFALTGEMGDCSEISKVDNKFSEKNSAMLYFLAKVGKIKRIIGLEKAINSKFVIGHHLSHIEGDAIIQKGTSDHVVIRFLIVCNNKNELREEILRIQDIIKIENEMEEDMLLPNFDINNI
jgi:biotin carboxylase